MTMQGARGHNHDSDAVRSYLTRRVDALERALRAGGVLGEDQVDDVIDLYTNRLGPGHGARLVARAWSDQDFKQRLLHDVTGVIQELGYDMQGGVHRELPFLELRVVENTPAVHNVIVCTLCSCYPLSLLGPQPRWYKSVEYRSRMVVQPRKTLAEFGLELPPDTVIRVWDSTAETRYMVLPQRPAGSEQMSEEELASLVTRDALIGVSTVGLGSPGTSQPNRAP